MKLDNSTGNGLSTPLPKCSIEPQFSIGEGRAACSNDEAIRALIDWRRTNDTAPTLAQKFLKSASLIEVNLIEQIIAVKFTQLKPEEVKKMLGIQEELLKETEFYKGLYEEIKAEVEAKVKAAHAEIERLKKELGKS